MTSCFWPSWEEKLNHLASLSTHWVKNARYLAQLYEWYHTSCVLQNQRQVLHMTSPTSACWGSVHTHGTVYVISHYGNQPTTTSPIPLHSWTVSCPDLTLTWTVSCPDRTLTWTVSCPDRTLTWTVSCPDPTLTWEWGSGDYISTLLDMPSQQ